MAIYEVTVRGSYFEQQWINTFAYVATEEVGGEPSAAELFALMGWELDAPSGEFPADTLARAIQDLWSTSVSVTEVEVRNLYSETDFYLAGYNPAALGLGAGVAVSPTIAYGLRSNRVRTDIRRGFKRLVGVVEEAMLSGGILGTGYANGLALIAGYMSTTLISGDDTPYRPAVLSFEDYVTPSGRTAYRPYSTEALQLDHSAINVTWAGYPQVRTQTSRQYGRGQ